MLGPACGRWSEVARQLRRGSTTCGSSTRATSAPALAAARDRAPRSIVRLSSRRSARAARLVLRWLEEACPERINPKRSFAQQPDLVLMTPPWTSAAAARSLRRRPAARRAPYCRWGAGITCRARRCCAPSIAWSSEQAQRREAVDCTRRRTASSSPGRSATTSGSTVRPASWVFCAKVGLRPTGRSCCSPARRSSRHRPSPRSWSSGSGGALGADPRLRASASCAAASARLDGVEGRRSVRLPQRRVLGRASGGRRGQGRLLRSMFYSAAVVD